MHYYKFNIGDYAKATRHLTNLEDLAYRRLLELYYDTEQALCDDVKELARRINMRENIGEIEIVLADFFTHHEGCFVSKRVEKELEEYRVKASVARDNGKKGGRPKKTEEKPNGFPIGTEEKPNSNPEESESKANHKPLTINQEPITNKQLYTDETLSLVNDFIKIVSESFGKTSPKIRDNTVHSYCDVIDKLQRIDGFSFDDIKKALMFGLNDPFWQKNILSISTLRKKSKSNDLTKFQNLYNAMKSDGKFCHKSKQQINNEIQEVGNEIQQRTGFDPNAILEEGDGCWNVDPLSLTLPE